MFHDMFMLHQHSLVEISKLSLISSLPLQDPEFLDGIFGGGRGSSPQRTGRGAFILDCVELQLSFASVLLFWVEERC
jgi:hypothetical protein